MEEVKQAAARDREMSFLGGKKTSPLPLQQPRRCGVSGVLGAEGRRPQVERGLRCALASSGPGFSSREAHPSGNRSLQSHPRPPVSRPAPGPEQNPERRGPSRRSADPLPGGVNFSSARLGVPPSRAPDSAPSPLPAARAGGPAGEGGRPQPRRWPGGAPAGRSRGCSVQRRD